MLTDAEPPRSFMPDLKILSYEVATTSIIYGLLPFEQERVLNSHRGLFHLEAAKNKCVFGVGTYNLCCQYYKNVQVLDTVGTHTDSEDSLFESDDEGMPPLLPVEPSEAGSDAASPKAALAEPNTSNTALPASAEAPWATARNLYWASLGINASATTDAPSSTPFTECEFSEHQWAEISLGVTRGMAPGFCRSVDQETTAADAEVHQVRIISLRGVRDVECACQDGLHGVHRRRQTFAFRDTDGNVVIKKSKTLLLPLN
ncbi:hypothetical protein B0H13DRAFT_2305697 [Mycena leptocephala]|nr:hypothetical protein B0H13DRAFT_2305697 [Mycena leptocephala]